MIAKPYCEPSQSRPILLHYITLHCISLDYPAKVSKAWPIENTTCNLTYLKSQSYRMSPFSFCDREYSNLLDFALFP
jgi:hypothetical protein